MEMHATYSAMHAIRIASLEHASRERPSSATAVQSDSNGDRIFQVRDTAGTMQPEFHGSALLTRSLVGVHEFVRATNNLFRTQAKALEFVVSVEPRRVSVRLIDLEFGEVIREYELGSAPLLDETFGEFVPGQLLAAVA